MYIGNSSWLLCPDDLESIVLVQQTDQPYITNKINNYSTMAKTKKISIQCVSSLRAKEVNTLTNYMRYCWIDVHCDDAMCTADSGLIRRALPRCDVYADDSFTTPTRPMWVCDSRFDRIATIILRQCLARLVFQRVNPCF